jgi:hypothetical protein
MTMNSSNFQLPLQQADITSLYREGEALLDRLDDAGLHQAAAHVSMALDAMRRTITSFG